MRELDRHQLAALGTPQDSLAASVGITAPEPVRFADGEAGSAHQQTQRPLTRALAGVVEPEGHSLGPSGTVRHGGSARGGLTPPAGDSVTQLALNLASCVEPWTGIGVPS